MAGGGGTEYLGSAFIIDGGKPELSAVRSAPRMTSAAGATTGAMMKDTRRIKIAFLTNRLRPDPQSRYGTKTELPNQVPPNIGTRSERCQRSSTHRLNHADRTANPSVKVCTLNSSEKRDLPQIE